MNKDRVAGKVKDATGRLERQAGEWTGNKKKQAQGALKQVEGKLQHAWGKAQDAGQKAADPARARKTNHQATDSIENEAGEAADQKDIRA
jgi:uncharacterized protein YjbJ (UPF0337 family)